MLSCQYTHSRSRENVLSIYLHNSQFSEKDMDAVIMYRLNISTHVAVLSIYIHKSQLSEIDINVFMPIHA